jgi:hypothetical protein
MKKSLGIFALAFVIIAPALTQAADAAQASARSKKHRLEPAYVSSIIKDETGTPVIMQGLERPKRAIGNRHHTNKEARRRVSIPRGSAYFDASRRITWSALASRFCRGLSEMNRRPVLVV